MVSAEVPYIKERIHPRVRAGVCVVYVGLNTAPLAGFRRRVQPLHRRAVGAWSTVLRGAVNSARAWASFCWALTTSACAGFRQTQWQAGAQSGPAHSGRPAWNWDFSRLPARCPNLILYIGIDRRNNEPTEAETAGGLYGAHIVQCRSEKFSLPAH